MDTAELIVVLLPIPGDPARRSAAIPQPNGQAAPCDGNAQLVNGRYTMSVDVRDGEAGGGGTTLYAAGPG